MNKNIEDIRLSERTRTNMSRDLMRAYGKSLYNDEESKQIEVIQGYINRAWPGQMILILPLIMMLTMRNPLSLLVGKRPAMIY